MDSNEAFEAAEGLNVLAHDYGLYAVKTRLDHIPSRAGLSRDTYDGIDDAGRELYDRLKPLALKADPYSVPDWADEILTQIEKPCD